IWNVRGLNKRDHQLAVQDIVAEFRLRLLGLLETRVRINNVAAIQSFLLPNWKWFVDYGMVGNRIWIAWDDNFIDVDVVECGTQFIHCLVYIRSIRESIAITMIYGATEVADRRELWGSLETIAMQTGDIPWLIGGDFNAVRDISEICGASGDVRMAMEEFNDCIQNAGLLPLPMQGEWYTWHNCSASPRNLWKRFGNITLFGAPMYAVTRKLKALKQVFREQRRNKGDLSHNVQLAKGFLEMAQLLYAPTTSKNAVDEGGDQCSRVFFRKIAQRRSARRILQINDDHGATHTEPQEVVNEFVMYYQNLLGGEQRKDVIDLRFLRPWVRHLLSEEDVNSLLLPFTPADVKQAVFDIAEDKAPGPDGYSSGFFKAAWPIVGQEVTSAVLDFFNTGRLLKQINTTLLALIPKWIEMCVTTTSFSVGLNGKPHGFFKGARGLRQGDPLSPYLFVLVMEVLHLSFLQLIDQDELFSFHWKCDSARVFQLGFADDLLLFCHADMDSNGVFKTGLDRFAVWSGLRLNVQKSHLIISRSAQGLRDEMLTALGFQEGVLPMRYLGLPLLSSRLTIADCRPLLMKIDKRIAGWEGIALSYAGRVQIIKSVLMALSLYWASAFILPKKVTNEIEKRLRTFLWKGTSTSGYAKVAWKDLCRPKEEGGLGFKDITLLNRALMAKKLCDIIRCDRTSIWVTWLYQGRLRDTSIWTISEHGGSWGWRKLLRLRIFLRSMVDYKIGDGRRFYLWQDPWHHLGPLRDTFPRGPRLLRLEESTKLCTVISGGEWQWPPITDFECLEITHTLPTIYGGEDHIIWRFDHGIPTTQTLYRLFDPPGPKVDWYSLLSGSLKIPRHLFILWLAILGKLATTDKPWLVHLGPCILCNDGATETHDHLFFQCRFSRQCITEIQKIIRFSWPNRDWMTDIIWASRRWRDFGVSLGLSRETPTDDFHVVLYYNVINETYIYPKKKLKHTQVPVWIKLRHLPMELWTEEGLSIVASGVGKPLYPDAITRACTRLDFAHVCVMLDATSNLPKHIIIMTPNEDGGESPCKIDVEYEWLPTRCNTCMTLGHTTKECAHNKTAKSIKTPVPGYVPKVKAPRAQVVSESNEEAMPNRGKEVSAVQRREKQTVIRDTPSLEVGPSREERGKALVIYNSFDALQLFDDAEGSSRGPKPCSPTEGDPC
ncbi:UNVERIFIED_CONTAM: hypothetical protein Sindi_2655600, partial [Sesamum indicum]